MAEMTVEKSVEWLTSDKVKNKPTQKTGNAMSCKHRSMDNLPFHSQKHCRNCGKSEQEIDLEAKLEAANDELSILNREISELRRGEGRGE